MVIKKAYVIGAGLTGLVTSYELKKGFDVEIIEHSNQVGGLAKSIKINNKDVDLGPHIYHSPDQDIIEYWKKEFPKLMHQRDHWAKNLRMGNFMIILFQENLLILLEKKQQIKLIMKLRM